jgi:hypothetical protein
MNSIFIPAKPTLLDARLPRIIITQGATIYPSAPLSIPRDSSHEALHQQLTGTGFYKAFQDGTINSLAQLEKLKKDYPEEYTKERLSGLWYLRWLLRYKEYAEASNLISNNIIEPDEKVLIMALTYATEEIILMILDHMRQPKINNQNNHCIIRWACANCSCLIITRLIQRGYIPDELCYHYILTRSDGFHTRRSLCEILYNIYNVPLGDNWYIETLRYSDEDIMYFLWKWGFERKVPLTSKMVDACVVYNGTRMLPALAKHKFPVNSCQWILFDLSQEFRMDVACRIEQLWGAMPHGSLDMAVLATSITLAIYLHAKGHTVKDARAVLMSFVRTDPRILATTTADSRMKMMQWTLTELRNELVPIASKVAPEMFLRKNYADDMVNNYSWIMNNMPSQIEINHKKIYDGYKSASTKYTTLYVFGQTCPSLQLSDVYKNLPRENLGKKYTKILPTVPIAIDDSVSDEDSYNSSDDEEDIDDDSDIMDDSDMYPPKLLTPCSSITEGSIYSETTASVPSDQQLPSLEFNPDSLLCTDSPTIGDLSIPEGME